MKKLIYTIFKNRSFSIPLSPFPSPLSPQKGFTLIELLLVIVIIGMLSTFAMANYMGARERARDAQRKSNLVQIQSALELYRADQADYPTSLPVCGSPFVANNTTYLQKIPCDPTNSNPYKYTYTLTGSTYLLIACLENTHDPQKDTDNKSDYCTGTSTSYTLTNP